jgi:hypothetical protein
MEHSNPKMFKLETQNRKNSIDRPIYRYNSGCPLLALTERIGTHLGSFWIILDHFWIISGSFLERFWNISGTFLEHSENFWEIMESFRSFWIIYGTFKP